MSDRNEELNKEQAREQAFIDAGFTVEKRGQLTIYRRPVSDDVIEASIYFSKRTIGYMSKDIPGRKNGRQG